MRRLSLLVLALTFASCTGRLTPNTAPVEPGPPVGIATPASGALTPAQLDAIAGDIRKLEGNPLGLGADDARDALFTWLVASPDVSGSLCSGVVAPFADSNSRYHRALLTHFILGLAVHQIENLDDQGDTAAINVGAMRSALTAYVALLDRDPRAKDDHMDRMFVRQRSGTLDEFIESATIDC